MRIQNVAIIGGGAMGQGIATLISQQGFSVVIKELSDELADKALKNVIDKIDGAVKRGQITNDKAQMAKNLLSATSSYAEMDPDLIIEAVFEKMEIKQKVFQELDENFPPDVIFASNTSALSIIQMAEVTTRPDKVIGMHFFNPPVRMMLIELISTNLTSPWTLKTVEDFSRNLGKIPIRVKECPAFLVNRLLMQYINEALRLLTETTLTAKAIDTEAKNFGWPMGPFELLDYLGIDVAYEVAQICHKGYGDRAKPPRLLDVLVSLKRFGQKTGAGFYVSLQKKNEFEPLENIIDREFPNRSLITASAGFTRMMYNMVNEAFVCLEEQISSATDIDTGTLYGLGFPPARVGPLHWAEKTGLANVLSGLESFGRFPPSELLRKHAVENIKLFGSEEDW